MPLEGLFDLDCFAEDLGSHVNSGLLGLQTAGTRDQSKTLTSARQTAEMISRNGPANGRISSSTRKDFESRVRMKEGSIVKETWFKTNKALGDFQDYTILEGGHYRV